MPVASFACGEEPLPPTAAVGVGWPRGPASPAQTESGPGRDQTARVTEVFEALRREAPGAKEELFQLVYGELRRLAGSFMKDQRKEHTLQPTALVHEAYLKLLGNEEASWNDRAHFMAAAARAMRSVLVDLARARGAQKRGGGHLRITLQEGLQGTPGTTEDLVAVHEALERLEQIDPDWSRVVELRFFAGLGVEEAAHVLGVSEPTVKRLWRGARAWLYRELNP